MKAIRKCRLSAINLSLTMILGAAGLGQHRAALAMPAPRDQANPSAAVSLELQDGEQRVIINLHDPVAIRANATERKLAVAAAQQAVLSVLPPQDFQLTRQYSSVPALAGVLNAHGLAILSRHPLVASIGLDEPTAVELMESVPALNAGEVHTAGYTGAGVRVAVLDTGVDTDHPDLSDDIVAQACFTQGDCPPGNTNTGTSAEDEHGHGTHVTGIITAPNGFAPDAEIVAVRVMNASGGGLVSDMVAGLDWIRTNQGTLGVDVVNMSLGTTSLYSGTCDSVPGLTAMASAMAQLYSGGVVIFAATANNGSSSQIAAPACITGVVGVGATYDGDLGREPDAGTYSSAPCFDPASSLNTITCFTNSSSTMDIVAPGARITSSNIGGGNATRVGTSMASPTAAGVAALMLDVQPGLTPTQIETVLESTGTAVTDPKNGLSFPRIDALAAASAVVSTVEISGSWSYYDEAMQPTPVRNAVVQVWDDDPIVDDVMGWGRTDEQGEYHILVPNWDQEGGIDVYVMVWTADDDFPEYATLRFHNFAGTIYSDQSPVTSNIPNGGFDAGARTIADPAKRQAFHLYDTIAADAFDFFSELGWLNTRSLDVNWELPNTTNGTHYHVGSNVMDVLGADGWDEDVILREYGRFVMDQAYSTFPGTCLPGSWGVHTTEACAWVDGWALFVQGAIQGHEDFIDTGNQELHYHMELPSPGADHPQDPGAIAASLWDIFDASVPGEAHDMLDDGMNGPGGGGIWDVFRDHEPNTMLDFYDSWESLGRGDSCRVAAILEHHGIDYGEPCAYGFIKSSPANGTGGQSTSPTLEWTPSAGATSYEYCYDTSNDNQCTNWTLSPNGVTPSVTLVSLWGNTTYYWHARASNTGGAPYTYSDGSPTAFWSFTTAGSGGVLLVDDDDNAPDVRSYYTAALTDLGIPYTVWDTTASGAEPSAAVLSGYHSVFWFSGAARGDTAGPASPTSEVSLGHFLDGGGCFFISSQDYFEWKGYDPTDFMQSYLGVLNVTNDVGPDRVAGQGSVFGGLTYWTLSYPFGDKNDSMNPTASAEYAFQWTQSPVGLAVDKRTGSYLTAYLGFPVEALPTSTARTQVLERFVNACAGIAVTAPYVPTAVTATDGTLSNRVQVSWDAPTSTSYYKVYRNTADTWMGASLLATPDLPPYEDTPPEIGTTYWYWVKACNSAGCSPFSSSDSGWSAAPPPAITVLLVDDDHNGPDARSYYAAALDVTGIPYDVWDTNNAAEPALADLVGHAAVIWYTGNASMDSAGPAPTTEASLSTHLHGGGCLLVSSSQYHFSRGLTTFMQSYLGAESIGEYANHSTVSGQGSVFGSIGSHTLAYPAMYASAFTDSVSPDVTAELAFSGSGGDAGVDKNTSTYHTAYVGFPIEALPSASLRVDVLSSFLNNCATTAVPAPVAPADVNASNGLFPDKVRVSWTSATGPAFYQVFRNTTDSSGTAALLEGSSLGPPFDDIPPESGTVYWYWVRACNAAGCSDLSASDTGWRHVTEAPPSAPTDLLATAVSTTRIDLAWSDNSDETSFHIERSADGSTGWVEIGTTASNVTTFSDTGGEGCTQYYYRVRAYHAGSGRYSLWSDVADATTTGCVAWCHVDVSATGKNNGKSWTNAYTHLESALADPACSEIWVAAGLYIPGTTRTDTFTVRAGTAVYGGFAGTETSREEREPASNTTILSGELGTNDANADGNNIAESASDIVGPNSYHVVTMDGTLNNITSSTVLDGFTITAGQAQEGLGNGGGLYCNGSGAAGVCSPTLRNLTFSGNWADYSGGALFNHAGTGGTSSPALTDVTFVGNSVGMGGGAVYNLGSESGTSSPELTNVTFVGNSASWSGGAMWTHGEIAGISDPVLTNVTFSGNHADYYGGAIMILDGSSPHLVNATLNTNSATMGGAISDSGANEPVLTSVILWGNTASTSDPQVFINNGAVPSITYSVVQGGCSALGGASCGEGNLNADPHLDSLKDNGGYTKTLAILAGSSAIDTGDDSACPAADQRGEPRPHGAHCDIGAYEYAVSSFSISGNAGIAGAILDYTGGETSADASGEYSFQVTEGWSGVVTPSRAGYVFTPDHLDYDPVFEDKTHQDYVAGFDAPHIIRVSPVNGSTSCKRPPVGVLIVPSDHVKTGGVFDQTKVVLTLNGTPVTNLAKISANMTSPASEIQMIYIPTSDLPLGTNIVRFIYPSATGQRTYEWSFSVTATTCPASGEQPPFNGNSMGAGEPSQ